MTSFLEGTWEYVQQGGWVMIPLAICSFAMWALILDRFLVLKSLSRGDIDPRSAIGALDREHVALDGPGLRRALLRAFLAARSGDSQLDRNILRQCMLHQRPLLRKNLSVIAVLASSAPLLGLLGTVLGMIETFNVIALFGTGNARAMASGISVALITTEAGLLVAIPGLVLTGLLIRRCRRLETSLDEFAHLLDRNLKLAGRQRAKGATA